MAKIRDYTITEYIANTLTWTPNMPVHAVGDLLIVAIGKDGTSGFTADPGGWSYTNKQASAGAYGAIYYKIAASSSETFSITLSTTDTGVIAVLSIKNVYAGGEINVSGVTGADDAAIPFLGLNSLSTTQANCLVLHFLVTDGGPAPTAHSPLTNLYSGDATNGGLGIAYTFQKASGAIPQASWFGNIDEDTREFIVAVRSGGDTEIEPYADVALTSGRVVRALVGLSVQQSDSWPTSLTIANLGDDFTAAYKYVGGTPTNILTALNNDTTADVTLPQTLADYTVFGYDTNWRYLTLNVTTSGSGGVLLWEYFNGSTWVSTEITNNLTATGWQWLDFGKVVQRLMQATTINSVSKYWIRATIVTTRYNTAPVLAQGRVNGHTTSYIVATAAADAGANPYNTATQNAGSSSVTNLAGPQINLGAAENLSSGILMGSVRPVSPRDFAIDIALPIEPAGGIGINLMDASNLYAAYKVGAKGCKSLDVAGRNVFAIDWNGTATAWAKRGAVSKSAVTKLWLYTFGFYGAVAIQWSMLILVTRVAVAGGSTEYPLNIADISRVANNCISVFPLMILTGSSALVYAPLQFGGGDPVFINCNLNTFQFPTQYDGDNYFDWNVANDVAGVKFYPKTGDVLKFTNCVFTSSSPYRWEFDAGSTSGSGWTGDFSGTNVVNATVTLRAVMTFQAMAFVDCPSLTQNSAMLSSCKISNTKLSCDAPGNISNCSFYSGGTGHGIEIGSTAGSGAYTFTGNKFSGYGADETADAAIYNNSGKAITLNIVGGGDVPTVRNGAGASTTINNTKSLALTGLKSNSEVRVYRTSDDAELSGIENSGTSFQYDYNYISDVNVYIVVHALNYLSIRYEGQVLGSSGLTIPVQQQTDRQYLNP